VSQLWPEPESPIEELLALALDRFLASAVTIAGARVIVARQVPVGAIYFADFEIRLTAGDAIVSVFVEADGLEFHGRTEKAFRHDRKRDRFFASHGLTVLRFTGSEIWQDGPGCVREVATALISKVERQKDLTELRRRVAAIESMRKVAP
jgi:very-short-patch-repair endonuclease